MIAVPRLVITGAPASGKTVFFERLKTQPEFRDFAFLDEVARSVLAENPAIRGHWLEFHREIYRRQLAQLERAATAPLISDRGTADTLAFCPHHLEELHTSLQIERDRYTGAVQLGSAANLGDRYYRTDDVRTETVDQVLAIERAITAAWSPHPNYYFVPADPDPDRKYHRLLEHLLRLARR